jgi:hypothetical protein
VIILSINSRALGWKQEFVRGFLNQAAFAVLAQINEALIEIDYLAYIWSRVPLAATITCHEPHFHESSQPHSTLQHFGLLRFLSATTTHHHTPPHHPPYCS